MKNTNTLQKDDLAMATSHSADATEKLLNRVLEKMEKLILIYTQELDVLSVGDMAKFQSYQPEKIKLIRECELGVAEIANQKEAVAKSNTILKQRLLSTHKTLSELADQSKRACESRSKSMQRIQDRLLRAARLVVSQQGKKGYGRSGKSYDAHAHKPIATAINEAI